MTIAEKIFIICFIIIAIWFGWQFGQVKVQIDFNEARAQEIELPMRDYVLNEVKKSGLDEYEIYSLIKCESQWDINAIGRNADSLDLGLWQLNTKHHSEVTPACSFSYKCSTQQAIKILKERGFSEWTCGRGL